MVEVRFGEGVGGAFVSAGFEEVGIGGKRDGTERFHKVEKGEGGAHEKEGLVGAEVVEERGEMEFGIAQQESGGVAVVEAGEHVGEGRLRGFRGCWCEEEGREVGGVWPTVGDGEIINLGIGEMVGSLGFGRRAGGEEGGGDGFSAGEGKVREFEGRGGDGGDFLPILDRFRGEIQVLGESLVGGVVGELMCEKSEGEIVELVRIGVHDHPPDLVGEA